METNIEFLEKEFINARNNYASKILDSIVNEKTFWEYYPKLQDVLPVRGFIFDCPEILNKWNQDVFDVFEKNQTIHFDEVLGFINYYKNKPDQEKYLSENQKEIIKNNSIWEIMQEILKYTKENLVCGFYWDW